MVTTATPPPFPVAALWLITEPFTIFRPAPLVRYTPPPVTALFASATLPPSVAPSSVTTAAEPVAKITPPLVALLPLKVLSLTVIALLV